MISLIVGGISIPPEAALDLTQSYEPEQGAALLRMMNGNLKKQTQWQGKLATRIAGGGWIPIGLQALDYAATMTLACIAPRAIDAAGTSIVLPAARRADAGCTPRGFAIGADGRQVETSIGIATNTATLGAVAGALGYRVLYWPLLTVFAEPPTASVDARRAAYSWELNAKEA